MQHKTKNHFEVEDIYQYIIDISSISIAVVNGLLTYIIDVQVIEQEEGSLKRIIPKSNNS